MLALLFPTVPFGFPILVLSLFQATKIQSTQAIIMNTILNLDLKGIFHRKLFLASTWSSMMNSAKYMLIKTRGSLLGTSG